MSEKEEQGSLYPQLDEMVDGLVRSFENVGSNPTTSELARLDGERTKMLRMLNSAVLYSDLRGYLLKLYSTMSEAELQSWRKTADLLMRVADEEGMKKEEIADIKQHADLLYGVIAEVREKK
eukprot:17292-Rhodomonas_salina.1